MTVENVSTSPVEALSALNPTQLWPINDDQFSRYNSFPNTNQSPDQIGDAFLAEYGSVLNTALTGADGFGHLMIGADGQSAQAGLEGNIKRLDDLVQTAPRPLFVGVGPRKRVRPTMAAHVVGFTVTNEGSPQTIVVDAWGKMGRIPRTHGLCGLYLFVQK